TVVPRALDADAGRDDVHVVAVVREVRVRVVDVRAAGRRAEPTGRAVEVGQRRDRDDLRVGGRHEAVGVRGGVAGRDGVGDAGGDGGAYRLAEAAVGAGALAAGAAKAHVRDLDE